MRRLTLCPSLAVSLALACRCSPAPLDRTLTELTEEFSEEGAYFDTDNLISNETAYVQIVHALKPGELASGVYIGVGPEQNFNYIGRLRPEWAFIVDIRADNRLHHLLMNAMLAKSESPLEYLCWTFARDCRDAEDPANFESVLAAFETASPVEGLFDQRLDELVSHVVEQLRFGLDEAQRKTIESIYRSFFEAQLNLRFHSHGRAPMPHHPSYATLLRAQTPAGAPASFLSRPDDYRHLRSMANEGRLIPVVGDFSGDHALRSIARFMDERQLALSAFYLSNVEFYLLRAGTYDEFVENVRRIPRQPSSQLIRAYFSYGYPHPLSLPGHRSTLIRQNADRFLALYDQGLYRDYWDVSTLDYLE